MDTIEMTAAIRSGLRLPDGDVPVSDTEILSAIHDGYKDTAALALCVEETQDVVTTAGERTVPFTGIRVNYVERLDTVPPRGLLRVHPATFGLRPAAGSEPEFWFPWGDVVCLDPVPASAIPLRLYVADYPAEAPGEAEGDYIYADTAAYAWTDTVAYHWIRMTGGELTDLPPEFRECPLYFAFYAVALKLRAWKAALQWYNRYILSISRRKAEYIRRVPDRRRDREIPLSVRRTWNRGGAHGNP